MPSLAVAAGATTPNPGFSPCAIWSTTAAGVLVWDGSSWQRAALPGPVQLSVATASSSAQLVLTGITSAHPIHIIQLSNLVPATDGVNLGMQYSTDGGSTWMTTSQYEWGSLRNVSSGPTGSGSGGGGADYIFLNSNSLSITNDAGKGFTGSLTLHNLAGSGNRKMMTGQGVFPASGGVYAQVSLNGVTAFTTAVSAVKFFFSSGNIASGSARLFGVGG